MYLSLSLPTFSHPDVRSSLLTHFFIFFISLVVSVMFQYFTITLYFRSFCSFFLFLFFHCFSLFLFPSFFSISLSFLFPLFVSLSFRSLSLLLCVFYVLLFLLLFLFFNSLPLFPFISLFLPEACFICPSKSLNRFSFHVQSVQQICMNEHASVFSFHNPSLALFGYHSFITMQYFVLLALHGFSSAGRLKSPMFLH